MLTQCAWANATNCNLHALRIIGEYMNFSFSPPSSSLTPQVNVMSIWGKMDFTGYNPSCNYPGVSLGGICTWLNVTYSLDSSGVLHGQVYISNWIFATDSAYLRLRIGIVPYSFLLSATLPYAGPNLLNLTNPTVGINEVFVTSVSADMQAVVRKKICS